MVSLRGPIHILNFLLALIIPKLFVTFISGPSTQLLSFDLSKHINVRRNLEFIKYKKKSYLQKLKIKKSNVLLSWYNFTTI